ncbi:MAG TPA: hypothetical protein VGR85_03050, partial [Candidatus Limnocylindria bacterium]|nr:hypothetical protein [Candidatus Limnocylindria bacterium]
MSTAVDTTTTALAPFKEIRELAEQYPKERFHLLLPTTMMGISPLFIPTPTAVVVNPDDPRDVYDTPGGGGTVCFHSQALERIANAGGLDFDPSLERHEHDFKNEPLVCKISVGGWYIDSLGQRRLVGDGVTHDLRDESGRTKLLGGPGSKPVQVARQFICEQAKSRARNRVIRKTMNLASSYRKDELVIRDQVDGKSVARPKPFVAFRFRLNEADEDVKRALIARSVGAMSEVFGRVPELRQPESSDALEDVVIQGEVIESEPAIPDEPKPKEKVDVGAVIDAFGKAAKARPDAKVPATDEQLASLAYTLRDVWQLPNDK